ncbi:hypothetical protein FACS189475_09460 [Betaproteobacteria bacterium]|nr:hypothetical protein FACS189475_09460 [Betaproteobacteria bacterium]
MLLGMDGWTMLREIRKAGKDLSVLFLTARDQVDDRDNIPAVCIFRKRCGMNEVITVREKYGIEAG